MILNQSVRGKGVGSSGFTLLQSRAPSRVSQAVCPQVPLDPLDCTQVVFSLCLHQKVCKYWVYQLTFMESSDSLLYVEQSADSLPNCAESLRSLQLGNSSLWPHIDSQWADLGILNPPLASRTTFLQESDQKHSLWAVPWAAFSSRSCKEATAFLWPHFTHLAGRAAVGK